MRKIHTTICRIEGCGKKRHLRNTLCTTHCNLKYRNKPVDVPLHIKAGLPEGIVKICKKHGELTEDQVYRSPASTRKYASCKQCRRIAEKEMHRRNPHRKCTKNFHYLRGTTIKISKKDYETMSALQGHVCKICKQKERMKSMIPKYWKREKPLQRRLVLDHKHGSNILRGLLCAKCNLMLGYSQDNIEILESAISYLKSHK